MNVKTEWEQAFSEAMENEELDLSKELGDKYRSMMKAVEEYLNEAEKAYFRAGYIRGKMDAKKAGKE